MNNPICRCGREIKNLPDTFKDLGIWVCHQCGSKDIPKAKPETASKAEATRPTTKRCSDCGFIIELAHFSKNQSYCKTCAALRQAKIREQRKAAEVAR